MNTKPTCSDCIKAVIENGGRWTNQQIREAIKERFQIDFYNNTIAKYLSFMQNAGSVMSETVHKDGKNYDEYWFVKEEKKEKSKIATVQEVRLSIEELMDSCLEELDSYPDDHPEYFKILNQYNQLKRRNQKVA